MSDTKPHDEVLLERNNLCTEIDSGNPFFSDQNFLVSKREENLDSGSDICELNEEFIHDSSVDTFFNNILARSIERSQRHPKNLSIKNTIALNLFKSGKIDEAKKSYKQILEIDNKYLPAISKLAECYAIQNRIDKAIDIYKSAYQYFTNSHAFLSNYAILCLKNREYDKSLSLLIKARKLSPTDHSILNNIGMLHLIKKEPNKAINVLRSATIANINDYNSYNHLGICYALTDNLKKSIYYFKIAYSLNPANKSVVHNISNAYIESSQYDKAIALLGEYIEKNNSDIEQRKKLAWCFFKIGLYRKAIKELNNTLPYISDDEVKSRVSIYNNIAVSYQRLGQNDRAKGLLAKCFHIDSEPKDILYFNLMDIFIEDKEYDKARTVALEALKKNPSNSLFISYLGVCNINLENHKEAFSNFKRALKIDDKNIDAYLGMSSIEIDVFDNIDNAFEILRRGIIHYPKHPSMINNYAYCLILKGNLDEASKILESTQHTNNVQLFATKGLLQIKKGNIDKGRALYNRAAAIAKDQNLRNLVYQKKNLELCNYAIQNQKYNEAYRYIEKGLKYSGTKQKNFIDKLHALKKQIKAMV